MQDSLLIIIDISGSMKEMGKHLLERNLCKFIRQLVKYDNNTYSSVKVRFFIWSESVLEIADNDDEGFVAIVPYGTADLEVLQNFLTTYQNNFESTRILILSDGYFKDDEQSGLPTSIKDVSSVTIRTVAIGADANLERLKKLSSNNSVFLPENTNSAVFSTVFGSDVRIPPPCPTSDIVKKEAQEDNWDDE